MGDIPIFKTVKFWLDEYGRSGAPDQIGIQDFMTCETNELVRSLQAELIAISNGNFHPASMDKLVGLGRKEKFNGYEEWAKRMLLWISSYKG